MTKETNNKHNVILRFPVNIALNKIIVTISDLRLFALNVQLEGMHPYKHKNKTKSEK